jgi:hypothetical protein
MKDYCLGPRQIQTTKALEKMQEAMVLFFSFKNLSQSTIRMGLR